MQILLCSAFSLALQRMRQSELDVAHIPAPDALALVFKAAFCAAIRF